MLPSKQTSRMVMGCFAFFLVTSFSSAQTLPFSKFEGLWETSGYGYLIEIGEERFTRFDVTSIGAIPVEQGSSQELDRDWEVIDGPIGSDRIVAKHRDGLTEYVWTRVQSIPPRWVEEPAPKPDDPEYNFEFFWNTFNDHAAFSELKGIDWAAFYAETRGRVTPETTDAELSRIICTVISSFNDPHTGFEGEEKQCLDGDPPAYVEKVFADFASSSEWTDFDQWIMEVKKRIGGNINRLHLNGAGEKVCQSRILWGELSERIGYINLFAMGGYTEGGGGLPEEIRTLNSALDRILESFRDKAGLVVDVRYNTGGYDTVGIEIANRFADQERLAYTKSARTRVGFTVPQKVFIHPQGQFRFEGPVVVLASEVTVSAGETFLMAMKRLPQVTVVGERTQGALSDALSKELPNGWTFSLSNEVYLTPEGESWEDVGIPPDTTLDEVTVPYDEELADPILSRIEDFFIE